jgi:hypothetical protein
LLAVGLGGGLARADESRTDVVAHTRAPIEAGRNAVWCATFQLAWDAMGAAVGSGGDLPLEAPAPAETVAEMNRHAFPASALDAPSFLVVAGLVRDGVLEQARAAWRERFGEEPPEVRAGPLDAVAMAGLRKDLPFQTPFRVLPYALRFGEGGRRVRAFGMEQYDHAPDVEALAKQVVVWLEPEASEDSPSDRPAVMELVPQGGADRIVLSSLPRGATLEETWAAAWARISTGRRWTLTGRPEVAVPRVRLRSRHRFSELVGAPIRGIDGSRVTEAMQRIDFSLTEKGASLASDAVVAAYLGIEPRLVFDRPFLLALLRRGEERPYLLVWVENEDLLEPYAFPAAPKERVAAFVGRWSMDLAPTVRTNAAGLPFDVDEVREMFAEREVEVDLSADGRGEIRWRAREQEPGGAGGWTRVPGFVGLMDEGLALVPDALAEESATEEWETRQPFPLAIVDGGPRVRLYDGWIVLRAR